MKSLAFVSAMPVAVLLAGAAVFGCSGQDSAQAPSATTESATEAIRFVDGGANEESDGCAPEQATPQSSLDASAGSGLPSLGDGGFENAGPFGGPRGNGGPLDAAGTDGGYAPDGGHFVHDDDGRKESDGRRHGRNGGPILIDAG